MDFEKINHCFTTAINQLAEQEIETINEAQEKKSTKSPPWKKWKSATINVPVQNQVTPKLKKVTHLGVWGVAKEPDYGWTVTHIPSGILILRFFDHKSGAKTAVEEMIEENPRLLNIGNNMLLGDMVEAQKVLGPHLQFMQDFERKHRHTKKKEPEKISEPEVLSPDDTVPFTSPKKWTRTTFIWKSQRFGEIVLKGVMKGVWAIAKTPKTLNTMYSVFHGPTKTDVFGGFKTQKKAKDALKEILEQFPEFTMISKNDTTTTALVSKLRENLGPLRSIITQYGGII